MTHLRRKMLEELERRNYSEGTTRRYLRFVERFAQHFGKSPDKLGPAARVHRAFSALALICVALWGYASWSTMGLTLPSELFSQDVAPGVVGAAFTFAVGFLVDRLSYAPAFLDRKKLLPIVATGCLFLLISPPATTIPKA